MSTAFYTTLAPLLDRVRGETPLDVQALINMTMALGRLIYYGGKSIASGNINPVIVSAGGEGAVVVDPLPARGDIG